MHQVDVLSISIELIRFIDTLPFRMHRLKKRIEIYNKQQGTRKVRDIRESIDDVFCGPSIRRVRRILLLYQTSLLCRVASTFFD